MPLRLGGPATVLRTAKAPPTPAPVPAPGTTGSGHETGNHNGDHQNTDKTATTDKKSVKTETNAQNGKQDDGGNRKQDDGGNRGNHHRNISD